MNSDMARVPVYLLLLALATSVRSQFFADLFQGFQQFVTNKPTTRQTYEQSSRRMKTDQNIGNYYRQTTKTEHTTKSYDSERKSNVFPPVIDIIEETERRRKTTFNNFYYTTTVKPKIKESSRRINSNRKDQAAHVDYNSSIKDYDGKVNSISDYYTQKPNYDSNNRERGNYDTNNRGTGNYDGNNRGTGNYDSNNRGTRNYDGNNRGTGNYDGNNRGTGNYDGNNRGTGNYDGNNRGTGNYDSTNRGTGNYDSNNRATGNYGLNNYYTTNNPLINRPGVRPAVVDNRPPITNRPVTKRPNYGVNPRPKDKDSIAFPGDDATPEVIIGPDEDNMSAVEKKRYIELAERMCDKYKSLSTKAVQAIPLVPSPEPVQVNVTACTPTTVPLVVGGKVVRIEEFPHMALLGWRKLQGPGYSWKCGGSLVSDQYILTAAHCSYQDRDNTVVNGPPTAVQLGSSYLDDPGALVVRVAAVIRHPKYKQPRSYYDLALVKLGNAVKFSEVIKPACLGAPPAVGKSVITTGWGRTEYGGDQSHELRSVSLPVWAMSRCREVLGTSRKLPDGPSGDSQVCAGEERGGKDTCQGDSGGPAQLQEGCVWRVVAVTSLGRSCGAAETPGLYAKVHRAFVASQVFGSQNYGDNNNNHGNNNNNYGSNNNNYGINNNNYGSNNGQNYDNSQDYGNRGENYNNQNHGNRGQNYDANNGQNYGDTERPSFRPQIITTTTQPEGNMNYNNGKKKPNNYDYGQDSQNYNTRKPDRNNDGHNFGNEASNVNYGSNNRNYYNNYNSYTTQRPSRYDSSGIGYNNYNIDYNRRQDGQDAYTTRKSIANTGDRGVMNSETYNYDNNNRDKSNYDRVNNYNTHNSNGNNRRTSNGYTVGRPWWL